MYSSSDFEHLFIRYKAEGLPEGESIQAFCLKNETPYNLFHKWYKDTRHLKGIRQKIEKNLGCMGLKRYFCRKIAGL